MNKPPDETLKQGRNRSWLIIKSVRPLSTVPRPSMMSKVICALCKTFRYRMDSAFTIAIQKKNKPKGLIVDELLAHARK